MPEINEGVLSAEDGAFVLRWLTGLRSGIYAQTKGTLQAGDGYCCLGIACLVSEVPIRQYTAESGNCDWLSGVDLRDQPAVWDLFDRLSLSYRGRVDYHLNSGLERMVSLDDLNDHLGFTFPEIADFIEVTYGSMWGLHA